MKTRIYHTVAAGPKSGADVVMIYGSWIYNYLCDQYLHFVPYRSSFSLFARDALIYYFDDALLV